MKTKRTIIVIANILWLIGVFTLLVLPQDMFNKKEEIPYMDKVAHIALFGIMSFLLSVLVYNFSKMRLAGIYAISISAVTCFGAIMEILQQQYFERSCDIFDVLADFSGTIIACFLFPYLHKLLRKMSEGLFTMRK